MGVVRQNIERAVIVDHEGYFVGAVRWNRGDLAPWQGKTGIVKFRKGMKRLKPDQLYALTQPEALSPPSEKARWNFRSERWTTPTKTYAIINERTGQYVAQTKQWARRLGRLPDGLAYVDKPAPRSRARKPIYDEEADEWKFPRRVALVDPDGVVRNIVNENPRSDTENVKLPEGWTRFDDDSEWPTKENGDPIGIGDTVGS